MLMNLVQAKEEKMDMDPQEDKTIVDYSNEIQDLHRLQYKLEGERENYNDKEANKKLKEIEEKISELNNKRRKLIDKGEEEKLVIEESTPVKPIKVTKEDRLSEIKHEIKRMNGQYKDLIDSYRMAIEAMKQASKDKAEMRVEINKLRTKIKLGGKK